MAALNALFRAFWEMPPMTRMYMSASVATTLAVQLELISPFQLYFNPKLIFNSHQYWRLVTTFLFFGTLGFSFLFNLLFAYRYCRMLEEEFFRNRTADFFYMFLVGGALMCVLAYFVNLLFTSQAFAIMLVYVWSRRNPSVRMNLFGLLSFQAPYLPWVLLALSILMGNSTVVDIIGIIVGHFYYFFEDVFPNEPHGFRILETPRCINVLFTRLGIDEPPLPEEDRPEQFNFANDPRRDNTSAGQGQAPAPAQSSAPDGVQPPAENLDNNDRNRTEANQDNELRARNVNRNDT